MKAWTRRSFGLAAAATCAGTFSAPILADTGFPSRPIRIVVPTTAGGNLDSVARVVAERMTAALGQPVIVENRTGASSSIGTRYVAQSTPDGHTILMMGNTFASTPAIMAGAGYDPIKDFVGVTMLTRLPELLIVPAASEYKSLRELIDAAKARPSRITYASAGVGSVARFAAERLGRQLDLKFTHVPYKGNGDALVDMVAGRVDMMFDQMSSSLPHVAAGKLRALAITSTTRSDVLPAVPTFAECGVPDFVDYTWLGFVVPATVPAEIVARLNGVLVKIVQAPEMRARYASQGQETVGSSSQEFSAFIHQEVIRLTQLALQANIKLE